jgi:hypothetical protein
VTFTCPCGAAFEGEIRQDVIEIGIDRRVGYHVPKYCPACHAAFEEGLALDREEIQRRRAS